MEAILEQVPLTGSSIAKCAVGDGFLAPPPVPSFHSVSRSKTARRPQRSSPLAGPAMSVIEVDAEKPPSHLRASAIISRRDADFLSPSPRHGQSATPRPKSMFSESSSPSLHPKSVASRNISHTTGANRPLRPLSAFVPSNATIPEASTIARVHFPDRSGNSSIGTDESSIGLRNRRDIRNNNITKAPDQPLNLPTITLNSQSITIPETIPQLPPAAKSPTRSRSTTSLPRDNSWYVTSTYDETPRFSRLGLSSETVVMPVSAKQYRTNTIRQRPQSLYHSGQPVNDSSRSAKINLDSADSSLNKAKSRSRASLRSFLNPMASTSSLKLNKTDTKSSSDHQDAISPSISPSSTAISVTFPNSGSPTTPTSASSSPETSPCRTRTNSLNSGSASSCSSPDIFINEEPPAAVRRSRSSRSLPPVRKGASQTEKIPPLPQTRVLLKKPSGRIAHPPVPSFIPDTKSVSTPALDITKKRRGGPFRKLLKFFTS